MKVVALFVFNVEILPLALSREYCEFFIDMHEYKRYSLPMNSLTDATLGLANMRPDEDSTGHAQWRYINCYMPAIKPENGIATREFSKLRIFPTQADMEEAERIRGSVVRIPGHSPDHLEYISSDNGPCGKILQEVFIRMADEMRVFLRRCREDGHPPFDTLDKKFRLLSTRLPLSLQEEKSKVSIAFSNIPAPVGFIEDYIDYYLYLFPALNGAFEMWRKNRVCMECGNIFFYKLERAKFCSTTCQMREAYKRRSAK